MSEYSMQFWSMIGTVATAVATVGLLVGAFMAWWKAKQTLDRMEKDSGEADERFFRDIMLRERHEGERRTNSAMFNLLDAASDLVAATNVSLTAVYEAGMQLRKANLKFVMTFELQKGQGAVEAFCATLTQVSKAAFSDVGTVPNGARELANRGFEFLFQSLLALQRGDVEMTDFLDGLLTFVDDVKSNHGIILGTSMYLDEEHMK